MRKILAIDDQKDNLTTIKAVMKIHMSDCKVLTALSGKEGIKIARKEQPDTILLDIIMPKMDGYEVCRRLKEDELTKHIPIIMITAIKTDSESRVKGLNMGADAFLSKPIDAVELSAQVKVMLRIKGAEDKLRMEKEVLDEKVKERTNELSESEKQYRLIAENTNDNISIASFDLKAKYIYVSPSVKTILDYEPEDLLGKSFFDFIHPEDKKVLFPLLKEYVNQKIKKLLTGKELPISKIIEFRFKSKAGNWHFMQSTVNIAGKHLIAVTRDIAERKLSEEALRISEKRFRTYFEQGLIGMAITSVEKGWIEVNDILCDMLGYSHEELYNMTWAELTYPEDLEPELLQFKRVLTREIKSYAIEKRFVHKNGRIVHTAVSVNALLKADDSVNYVLAVVHDITERKQAEDKIKESEEKLRNFVDFTPLGVWCFQPAKPVNLNIAEDKIIDEFFNSTCIECNDTYASMMGVSSKEILGLKLSDAMSDNEENRDYLRTFIKNGYKLSGGISKEITGDGEEKYFSNSMIGVIKNGKLINAWGTQADVTEQKQAEEALRDSERTHRTLINNLPGFTYRCQNDKDWTMDYISDVCEDITGYSSDDFMSKKIAFNDIIDVQYDKKIRNLWEKNLKEKTTFEFEYQIITKNQEVKWIWERGCGVYSDNGEVLYLEGFITDVTEHKRAEQVQKVIYNISNAVVTSISLKDFIGLIKIELGTLLDTSNFYIAFHDEKTDMFSSPFVSDEKDGFDTWPAGKSFSAYVLKTKKSLLVTKTEMFKMHANGLVDIVGTPSEVWMGVPLISDGIVNGIFAVQSYTDEKAYTKSDLEILEIIADQIAISIDRKQAEELIKESEERFALAMKASKDGLFDWNLVTNEIYYSENWKKMLGYKDDELPNKISTWQKLTHPEGREKSLKKMDWAIKNKIERYEEEFTMKHKLGHWVHILSRPEFVYNEKQEAIRVVGTHVDISKQREYERNLKDALHKAEESDRLKSTFLATMSHELRTPLNAIIGFSDIIDESLPLDTIVEFSKTINSSGNHLLNIVEDLFDITLIETGTVKIIKKEVEIQTILSDVHKIISVEKLDVGKSNLDLNLKIPKDSKKQILFTDSSKLKQILINLLKNALKFTHEGSVQYGYSVDTKNNMFKFFVKDTGIGIPLAKQELIFDVFRQVEDSHTREYGGTGIGLSISKKLTELLGGEIWLESTEGKGTVFYFSIPYEADEVSSEKNIELGMDSIVESKRDDTKKRLVLIVEDVAESFEFLKVVLESQGMNTMWAENGKIAVDYCKTNPDIDLVLMDINMPVMNGFEATKQIKEFNSTLPIIAQTAYAIVGDREKAIDAGCDDYISKPINRDKLMKIIKQYIE